MIKLKKHQKNMKSMRESLPAGVVSTQLEVARILNVSVRTVSNWIVEEMPVMPDGNYNLSDIQQWRANRKMGNKQTGGEKEDLSWDQQFRKNKALLAEIEYKKKIGELLPREEVEAGRVQRIMEVKTALISLPQILAPQLVGLEPREIQVILTGAIENIINRFASSDHMEIKNAGNDLVGSGTNSLETSEKNNSKPVGGSK